MTLFSFGVVELGLIAVFALFSGGLAMLRLSAWKWFAVTTVAIACAAAITPADPVSTLLMAVILLAFFGGGLASKALLASVKGFGKEPAIPSKSP